MFTELVNFILIIFIVAVQSILGIGVLVLGTPILLLLDMSMIDIMNYLLPISIITSLFNLVIMTISVGSVSKFPTIASFNPKMFWSKFV